jgi:hypothetical protein
MVHAGFTGAALFVHAVSRHNAGMDRLIWIALGVAFVFGLVMVAQRRPPRPPGTPGAGDVIKVDLADRR